MGTLFVVATPIGNLEDLTDRARTVLASVDLIACEDTRHTGKLLKRLGIERPLISVHSFNEASRTGPLIERLEQGDVALVSDAGTPGVSDPGALIVRAAAAAGFGVVPVPGPSALAAAMSITGFEPGPVLFLGFLSRKPTERQAELHHAMQSKAAIYLFESPQRVVRLLELAASIDPKREVVVLREVTKLHEEILRGPANELADELKRRDVIRGEIVVAVAAGASDASLSQTELENVVIRELQSGDSPSVVAKRVSSATGIARSAVYSTVERMKRESGVR